ncbi:hypothetical protein GGI15_003237 [Coemansia interrupta]|uniref:Uncharacterized protein n=1 Tax=Coemansia interrupta TaxID=1126814 RepID=A0A9W8LI27_9FUNG|nr:hypothetical protein GGI15_003237 [Coemansia interrupta]
MRESLSLFLVGGGGVFLIAAHLERMRRSGALLSEAYGKKCFDLSLSREQIERRVGSIVAAADNGSSKECVYRVRMLLGSTGDLEIQATPEPVKAQTGSANPVLVLDTQATDTDSVFVACKTTHRDIYNDAVARISKDMPASTQVLLYNRRGQITEGNIANVAVSVRDNDGKLQLLTPPTSAGLLAGTMRAHLLETGAIMEGTVTVEQFREAARNKWPIFCMNSVRGLYPVDVYL